MTAPGAPARLLESTLRIRSGEGRRTALLFLHLLLASAVFFLGRTVRDTLLLSRYPLTTLPWLFVIYGAVSAAVALLYGRLADRLSRPRVIAWTCAAGAVTYLGAWAGVRADLPLVFPAFYVWSEVVANLLIVQFWTLAADLHDARSARRLFGPIGSARLLASVLVGVGAVLLVRSIGTAQLILVLIALMAAIVAVTAVIRREPRIDAGRGSASSPHRRTRVWGDPYVRALALLVLLAFTALNIGDYQFKAVARASFTGDELARFFALFYAVSGSIAFLFQLFVTPRLLARAGVGAGMAVMPSAFGFSTLALLAWPRLPVAALLKFSDNGFQYTIQESTFQALYVPFPAAIKARTRALLDAVVKPLGLALAGFAIILLGSAFAGHPAWFSLVSLPLIIAWLALVPVVRRRYIRRLERTLSMHGSLGFDQAFALDAAGRRMLVRILWEGEPRQILLALEQLWRERAADVAQAVHMLAAHPNAEVREAALVYLIQSPPAGGAAADHSRVTAALSDPVPSVRAAAALAIAAIEQESAVLSLAPLLADPDPRTRSNALAGMMTSGPAGQAAGGAELRRLLESPDAGDHVVAARALSYLGKDAYELLVGLLASRATAVRRAALGSAATLADPRLTPALVTLFASDPACRVRAGQALVAIGGGAAEALAGLLGRDDVQRAARLEIPRLLRRMPQPASYELLRRHVHAADSRLRLRLFSALSQLRRRLALPPEPAAAVRELVRAEIEEAERSQAGLAAARTRFASPLLDELLKTRFDRVLRRVLRILELRYDQDALALVREHFVDPARRANALEVLDALLDAPLRAVVMPFADDAMRRPRAAAPDPVAFLASLCRHPNPYAAMVALDALARRAEPAGADAGAQLLEHPDPMVREAAARAIAAVRSDATPEKPMYSTLEKILFLKSAAIFERVTGEDLVPIARIAEVQTWAAGDPIVLEGERGDALFVLVRGRANVERSGRVIAELGPGDSIGEMAVLDSEPRSATVRALADAETLRIGSEEFYEILHEQVEIAEGVIRVLSQRLRQQGDRLAS